jgi:hypothetical protein
MKIKVNKKIKESSSMSAGGMQGFTGPITNVGSRKKEKDMRIEEEQLTEKLLREYIRKKIRSYQQNEIKIQENQEHQLRLVIRNLINEAKEAANPHPNTGINKLRDAFRKAKPTLKTKYQQLTSSQEQRETFAAHMLRAFVRLFDELDALQAKGDVEGEVEDIETAVGEAPGLGLEAPPEGQEAEDVEDEIEDLLEAILKEVAVDVKTDDEIDVVSDEEEKQKEDNKTQVEKDFDKKKESDKEKEEFGAGLDGDATGRNQAFDAFRLVQTYFSDAYLDLSNEEDQKMYRDWCLYNMKLLFQNFEESLPTNPEEPEIENPEGA